MSYVGDPYKYDVFISYPHGVEALQGETTMREWSRKIASAIMEIVKVSLLDKPGGTSFEKYLDRDHLISGTPLTETLEDAVKKSAVFVMLMGPLYRNWCVKELRWFLEKARADGHGFRQCVLLEVQNTGDAWPDELRDTAGEPLFKKELKGERGLPLGYEKFMTTRELPDTGTLLTDIAIEITDKLLDVRARCEAQRIREASKANRWIRLEQRPDLDDPLIYLESEPQNCDIWERRRDELADAAIVLPEEIDAPAMAERENILTIYEDCDALVVHRVRPDESIGPRIRRAFQDLKLLDQKKKKGLAWAVLDELPDVPLPSARTFRVARVSALDPDWKDNLFKALGGVPAEAPASP